MIMKIIDSVGEKAILICNQFGEYGEFVANIIKVGFRQGFNTSKLFAQMERIGVDSLPICALIGVFSGAVMTLQTYYGFTKFGSENMIGPVVALSLTRELGPVLTGLMVTGRSGSGIAAEIGTMRITEQIDALETLCINVYRYLMVPRVLASILILPFVTMFTMFFGIWGGYVIYVYYFHLNAVEFIDGIKDFLELSDITGGLIKGSVFGFILSSIGSFCGFHTRGGAKGVGLSTIQSVVISSIVILISNYFLAMLLFEKS
ncbi:ABC transporter permease [Candidatus Dependentiae bacterium]|nr:ABC transporter permease [Candidatus Dependentiae bacterium]